MSISMVVNRRVLKTYKQQMFKKEQYSRRLSDGNHNTISNGRVLNMRIVKSYKESSSADCSDGPSKDRSRQRPLNHF